MRILLVAHGYPPDEQAGTELYTEGLARELAELGHEVSVFAAHPALHLADPAVARPVHQLERRGNVELERVYRPLTAREDVRLREGEPAIEALYLAALKRTDADLVHVQHLLWLSSGLISLTRGHGIPVVVTLHDFWFLCPLVHLPATVRHLPGRFWGASCFWHTELTGIRPALSLVRRKRLHGAIAKHLRRPRRMRAELDVANLVIAPSEFVRDRYTAFTGRPSRIKVVPLGVEHSKPADGLGRLHEVMYFGYLGPLLPGKGADLLVRAFRGLDAPSARLILRGPDADQAYSRRVRELAAVDPRIAVNGPVPRGELAAFLTSLDLLIVPTCLQETYSFVVREAFSAGVPVLASEIGALTEIVEAGRNGLLFEAGNERELRATLKAITDHPCRLSDLRSFPCVLGIREHAEQLAELYAPLVARSRALPPQ
jgi:glycosyltransferase involved in cell wall biosynthesis